MENNSWADVIYCFIQRSADNRRHISRKERHRVEIIFKNKRNGAIYDDSRAINADY